MAYTPTDWWATVTDRTAVALIGEDHQGAWSRSPQSEAAIEAVVEWHEGKRKPITLWHEGQPQQKSQSFEVFVKWFKGEYLNTFTVKPWEAPPSQAQYTLEERLVMGLMGGDAAALEAQLGLNGLFIDRLVNEDAWKDDPAIERYTADDIRRLVSRGKHRSEYLKMLDEPITREVLGRWFTLREECFTDPGSGLYKIMMAPQVRREEWLAKKFRNNSGIFLVGESHIGEMRGRGLLRL